MTEPVTPTLRTIAEAAGVSRQTVSDALRGSGRVSKETRKEVQAIAQRLGYKRDPLVSAGLAQMRRTSKHRLKSVLAYIETGPFPNQTLMFPAFGRIFAGAKMRAEALGYAVELFWLNEFSGSPGRLESILHARGIRGTLVLYLRDWHQPEKPLNFNFKDFACVTLGARSRAPALHFAAADHFGNTVQALNELKALGSQRIGLVFPQPLDDLLEGRVSHAYFGWQTQLPKHQRIPIFNQYSQDGKPTYQPLLEWIDKYRPQAIYGLPNDNDFESLAKELRPMPLITHFDGNLVQRNHGTDQMHEAVGVAGVDMVDRQLYHGEFGIPKIARGLLIEGSWINAIAALPAEKIR